jgi:uncharacterized protein YbjT (DUF2867 family)
VTIAAPQTEEHVMFVITGVTGNTGSAAAETLLAQKRPVRVVVRDAAKGEAWKARGAEVAIADLDDVTALAKALRGATGAYLLLPPQMGSTDVHADNGRRTRGYVKAIEESAVPHVVFLSSVGAQHASGTGPIATVHHAEAELARTGAALTFVRAAYFMENWGGSLFALEQGALPSFLTVDRAIPMVATDDIGRTAARALVEGGKGTTVIELSGPRDLSPKDVASALSNVLGRPIAAQQGPAAAIVPALQGAGLNAHWAKLFEEMILAVNDGRVTWEGGSARAVRGKTEIDVVLRRLLKV